MAFKINREFIKRSVSIILRVPALFIAEVWFRIDPKTIVSHIHEEDHTQDIKLAAIDTTKEFLTYFTYYSALVYILALLLLPLKRLVNFYMYIVSGILIFAAHHLARTFVDHELLNINLSSVYSDHRIFGHLVVHILFQVFIAVIIDFLLQLKSSVTKVSLLVYTLPMLARAVNVAPHSLEMPLNISTLICVIVIVHHLFNNVHVAIEFVKRLVHGSMIGGQVYGWLPFIAAVWVSVFLPLQFLIFWLTIFSLELYHAVQTHTAHMAAGKYTLIFLASVAESCATPISLIGLSVTVSYLSSMCLTFTKYFLSGKTTRLRDIAIVHAGWTEGFTLLLIGLQTELLELHVTERAFLISLLLFIVVSSLMQSIYELTEPALLTLGASHSPDKARHMRAVLLTTVLWMLPIYMSATIRTYFDADIWLLIVITSCLLTSVQVLGTMIIYALFMYDGMLGSWKHLDDSIYYSKAVTHTLEFIVALFVLAYGAKESLMGESDQIHWLNTFLLFFHCYLNVFQRLQAGWKSYRMRQGVVSKLNQMSVATEQEVIIANDRCSICYSDMEGKDYSYIVKTKCLHLFHKCCIRKWLYVQNNCPLCAKSIAVDT